MKKITRAKLIEELRLLAAGANGGDVVLTDDYSTLPAYLSSAAFQQFAWAVSMRYFQDTPNGEVGLMLVTNLEQWSTFDTLADAILEERKRIKEKGQ